jgi:hypothetical protein
MRPRCGCWALLLILGACSRADSEGAELVLRYGVIDGISDPEKGPGSSVVANLAELIYRPAASTLLERRRVENFLLLALSGEETKVGWVAERLRHRNLRRVTIAKDTLVAEFDGSPPPLHELQLQDGPYQVVEFHQDERLVLRRRDKDGAHVDSIVVDNVASHEELWRRLLAGQVDLIPVSSTARLRNLGEVPSVKLVSFGWIDRIHLILNVARPGLDTPAGRHALAAILDVEAIADAGGGTPIEPRREYAAHSERIAALQARRLRIATYRGDALLTRALAAVGRSLNGAGIEHELVITDIDGMLRVLKDRQFDAFLFLMDSGDARLTQLHTRAPGNVITGYSNPRFDVAIDQGDLALAQSIFAEDLPAIPLYQLEYLYALDARLCNARPRVAYDLSWLADLRRCRPGQGE